MIEANTRGRLNAEFSREVLPLGKLFWLLGAVRFHRDGDGFGAVFRWWHPASWFAWVSLLPLCGIVGWKINELVPFRLKPYWRERREQIQWVSWFN